MTMRVLIVVAMATFAISSPPLAPRLEATTPIQQTDAQNSTEGVGSSASSGLPLRDTPARTTRAYWHVFAAFAVTWLLVFGYAITVGRRVGRLEQEIERLKV